MTTTLNGGGTYYLETQTFQCSGLLTSYRLNAEFSASQTWSDVLNATVAVIRDSAGSLLRVGEFIISIKYKDSKTETTSNSNSNSNMVTIEGVVNVEDRFPVQSGDYLRITLLAPVYNPNLTQFVNQHIPFSVTADSSQRVEHYFGCGTPDQCGFIVSRRIRVLMDLATTQGEWPMSI